MTNQLEDDLVALFEAQTRSLGCGTPPSLDGPVVVPLVGRRRSVRPLAIAAAMLLVLAGAGLWWMVDARRGSVPADTDTVLMPTEPPLFELRAAGWTISSYSETDPATSGEGSTTFVVAGDGVQGPRIDVYLSDSGSAPISDAEPQPATVGGQPAELLVDGDRAQVRWTHPGGHVLEATGTNVAVDDLVAVADAIDVVDGMPTATRALPGGFVAITRREAELMRTFYEYQWRDDSGLELQLSLYGGGKPVYDERITSLSDTVEDRTVDFQGAEAHVARDESMIRLDQVRGFWVIEISGYPQTLTNPDTGELATADAQFESIDQFLQIAEQLVTVDAVMWRASLPADIVLPDEIPATIEELAVFALPDGGTVTSIADDGFTQRRSAIAQAVAAQTSCAWLAELRTASDSDDPESAVAAANVIHDLAQWDELAAIPDTIVGTDALTLTGRIRQLDDSLEAVRSFDLDDPDADLGDLDINATVDAILEQPGVALDCIAA